MKFLKFFSFRSGELKRLHYFLLHTFVVSLIYGYASSHILMNGSLRTMFAFIIAGIIFQLLIDSKRLRNAGINPYFCLIGTFIIFCVFTLVMGNFSSSFIPLLEAQIANGDDVGLPNAENFIANLKALSFLTPISERIPFLIVWLIGFAYMVTLFFTKSLNKKNDQTAEPLDKKIEPYEVQGQNT